MLETNLFCAQKKIEVHCLPPKIPDLEYNALKSKNEVLKTLLTFEREY